MAFRDFMTYQMRILAFAATHDGITVAEAVDRYARIIRRHVNRTRGGVS